MRRFLFLAYGVVCHLLFLVVFAWLACFVGGWLVPNTIDGPATGEPWPRAAAINLLLLGAFCLQHSVMARPAFKRHWTRLVPAPIERSTYVLASCVVTGLLIWQWRPIDLTIWHVNSVAGRAAVWTVFALGWLAVPAVTLLISHFDLFGTRQVWLHWRGRDYEPLPFTTPGAYRWVRHPLYVGWTIAFFAAPTMTAGHLLFAISMTVYMAAASLLEERDLVEFYGEAYRRYRREVPAFVPRPCAATPSPSQTISDRQGAASQPAA
jgi:protein-S-isoprenylcysteine O-methyltransferase Ste14